ncbi:AMP-binding protein [Micromonospora sp. NPDC023633]|uniref:AMP-binding protein n=1 Tax=Micromonospora sp. NPDC023633 TaxID=3154320 RepID=UPI0033DA1560
MAAVVSDTTSLSYAELDVRANRPARYLVKRGARPERLVAVAMERSAEQIVAVLAVLMAGAAHLPDRPGLPRRSHRVHAQRRHSRGRPHLADHGHDPARRTGGRSG